MRVARSLGWELTVIVVLIAAFAPIGCGQAEKAEETNAASAHELLPTADGDPIVTVNGEVITDLQLERALARAPEGSDATDVLASLIEVQVTSQRAVEAGLHTLPDVAVLKRRAMVQRLLENEVEVESAADVPSELVRESYEAYGASSFEPELVTASHLLIELSESNRTGERLAAATALGTEVAAALRTIGAEREDGLPTDEDLDQLAELVFLRGFAASVDKSLTFPLRPVRNVTDRPQSFMAVVEPFADAAFALNAANPVSEPTVSEFGVHVIAFRSRKAGVRPPFDEVEEQLRADLLHQLWVHKTERLLARLREAADIQVNDGPVKSLGERKRK